MIVKVKEPKRNVVYYKNQILFAYLHLAPLPTCKSITIIGFSAIAYETVMDKRGPFTLTCTHE